MSNLRSEPGSFRDRRGKIFYWNGEIIRALSRRAVEEWQALAATRFFPRLMKTGKVVKTELLDAKGLEGSFSEAGEWAGFLSHEAIPFISYPYEWSFQMLKDAALLQLELIEAALGENMILKDASSFNLQWQGSQPVFIDIPSFERLSPGEPWVGYRQFCQLFLYPLLLQSYKNIPFQPWLRGSIDGISSQDCSQLMSWKDLFRKGVLTHVYLQSRLQSRYGGSDTDARRVLKTAGFNRDLIAANVRRMTQTVSALNWKDTRSEWSDYTSNNTYSEEDHQAKADFVRNTVQSRRWKLVWDLGCNTGVFSRICAENSDYVVAMDQDPAAVEIFYQGLKKEGSRSILPLVMNFTDPSPDLGWRCLERKTITGRGQPELTLCLALIHHIVIGSNVPAGEFVEWLAELQSSLVIEFVTKDDPMVQVLLRNKEDQYQDYGLDSFERSLGSCFEIERRLDLPSSTRVLYFATPRASSR